MSGIRYALFSLFISQLHARNDEELDDDDII